MTIKNFLYLIAFIAITLHSACKKDEPAPCTPPNLSQNVVGTWAVKATAFGQSTTSNVTFNANGTLTDNDGFLIDVSLNGEKLTDKTWSVSADEKQLKVTASKTGIGSSSSTYDVKSQTCNTIEASLDGFIDVSFSR